VKHAFLNVAGAAVLAAGMAFAQNAPAQNSPHAGRHGAQAGSMIDRLSARLNLTDAQKQQAQSIFAEARKSAQPVRAQIRQDRQALAAAVKSGSQADIDRISNNMGPLLAQASAIRERPLLSSMRPSHRIRRARWTSGSGSEPAEGMGNGIAGIHRRPLRLPARNRYSDGKGLTISGGPLPSSYSYLLQLSPSPRVVGRNTARDKG
jgi:Spy/CpxP family protein refolding chaperone